MTNLSPFIKRLKLPRPRPLRGPRPQKPRCAPRRRNSSRRVNYSKRRRRRRNRRGEKSMRQPLPRPGVRRGRQRTLEAQAGRSQTSGAKAGPRSAQAPEGRAQNHHRKLRRRRSSRAAPPKRAAPQLRQHALGGGGREVGHRAVACAAADIAAGARHSGGPIFNSGDSTASEPGKS